ncbi:TPA: tyrosine-type recombinase/integrase [Vibrio parahaemolyticus]|nr:tyrosine-type recombinase/integrase [Vibrio parahaemolyticus]EKB1967891.1 tyrosine-type recombinase/integrase [Vibrio parahaemolyticus]HCG8444194.1 tyrosine-type recombinase/integrase [Vibrio parahaemolyticus]HCG8445828.1 tyrosine-type recombinase/integrase [Vibrio parahaemolyticus]HCG8617183.1 tyrosine-type recombinase/integrase [Vibrio parahaemolyticus]
MNNKKKLHTPLRSLVVFKSFSQGKITTTDASNLPHIVFPDNTPCLIANLYMLALLQRKGKSNRPLSRRGRNGGTIGDYAGKIAQLIRYCYFRNISLHQLNDDSFTDFISELRKERDTRNPRHKRKNEETISNTGRVCLDFLDYVGNFYGENNFVSKDGVIYAEKKSYTSPSKKTPTNYWDHHSFIWAGRKKSRKPVSQKNIEKLYDAIYEMDSSKFISQRREIQINTLVNTGARRDEIADITVQDVQRAAAMDEPMLRLLTLKNDNGEREIPVSRMFINDLLKFIRISRAKIISKTIGKHNDHGWLFISETTGKKLSAETLSTEMYNIRTFAKIEEQVCNHMFRHAFCTNLFVLLIERHEFENEDKFRQQLMGQETFKAEVIQYTGHKITKSLDVYIKQAFARVSGYQKTVSSTEIIFAIQRFDDRNNVLLKKLEKGLISVTEYKMELDVLRKGRDEDITIAKVKIEQEQLQDSN